MNESRRAFVMVWDGLRPDFVSADLTPNLYRLSERGVRFADSHAVFPTVTRSNSATIATGALPASHGIPGNSFYAPRVDATRALNTGDHRSLEALRSARGGRLLLRSTLSELVARDGGACVVVGTGSPGSALLQHPQAAGVGGVLLNPAITIGHDRDALEARFGPVPERALPCTELNAYFTRVVVEFVLPDLSPRLLTFWHTDPDGVQHARGVGHPDALAGIRNADTNLGVILDAIERLGHAGDTDVIVTSDHGFSTVNGNVDVTSALVDAGVKSSAESTDVVVTDGFVYVPGGDQATVRRAVEVLQGLDGVGSLFTGARGVAVVDGTLPLASIAADGELAPDILFSPDWDNEGNEHSVPGRAWAWSDRFLAMHGSLSPWDVRNTLIAAGPDFKRGVVSEVPAGTVDIVPTLQRVLDIEPAAGEPPPDGRVLDEALEGGPDASSVAVERTTLTAETANFGQELHLSRAAGAQYVDFGRAHRT